LQIVAVQGGEQRALLFLTVLKQASARDGAESHLLGMRDADESKSGRHCGQEMVGDACWTAMSAHRSAMIIAAREINQGSAYN
jgi:hypothetical protein